MSISVLLVDDHKMFRDCLHAKLQTQSDFKIVGTADSGRTAIRLTQQLKPKIVVIDINMQDIGGIEATRRIISDSPRTRVLALTMYSDARFVEGMLKAGVSAYVLKDCSIEELYHAIRSAAEGKTYFCQQVAGTVIESCLAHNHPESSAPPHLTKREKQVLQKITKGRKTQQIASSLDISVKTVETYRRQIMKKLNIDSIVELTKFAIREGYASLE
jgi:DNA-binding NarL/FixJ family response regulator